MAPKSVSAQNRDWPTYLTAVVEVVADDNGGVPGDVLQAAYHDSQHGVIALSLSNLSISAVNKRLDAIVPHYPLDIPGVRFLKTANSFLLKWVLCHAWQAYGKTSTFHDTAVGAGFLPTVSRYDCGCLVEFVKRGPVRSEVGRDTPTIIGLRETQTRLLSHGT